MSHSEPIDWSQLWYPGPRRVFTDAELARAGGDRPSRTLTVVLVINLAIWAQMLLQAAPPELTARLTAFLAGLAVAALTQARALWRRPTRRALLRRTLAVLGVFQLLVLGIMWRTDDPAQRHWLLYSGAASLLLCNVGFWFVTVFRAQQIASRLRELDERDRAVAMAHQLAAAQIQPHFLFNSLAALQHWVQQKDDRAAPMLESLTGFLRATLPLFDRGSLRLGDEAAAVQRYLEVMRLRLGERLRARVDIPPAAADAMLPPGVLLTLVENAIEHGVLPSLSGAELSVQARVEGDMLTIEVSDSGPGLAADAGDGVGLANSRTRLRQACGEAATLTLHDRAQGGCTATVRIPYRPAPSGAMPPAAPTDPIAE